MIEIKFMCILILVSSMKKLYRYQVDKSLLILLILFSFISFITISSAQTLLPSYMQDLVWKQMIWYLIGFLLIYFVVSMGAQYFYKSVWYLYGIGIVSLFLLLIFGKPINDAKCWFQIPQIGSVQPSEFMKIILILTEGVMIDHFHKKIKHPRWKDEFIFLLKIGFIVFIPSILTFLEPDTGVVLIYLLITFIMLFVSGIRYGWFLLLLLGSISFIGFLLGFYFLNQNLFIQIFGSSFFLRMDRLLDWSHKSGFQLENGLAAIGSSGFLGHGYKKTPVYFPEPQTDFIFAVYASNFGFLGSIFLIGLFLYFDLSMIKIAVKAHKNIHKYVISGIIGMLIYQQVQNIGMTFGIMPITGITLPFISYGGSSLLSYMFMMGIVFSISNETIRFTNQ